MKQADPRIDEVIALVDRIEQDAGRLRSLIAGRVDPATALHGPARPADEGFISSGAAARLFGVSDDTIRRHAKQHGISRTGSARCVRYSANELRAHFQQK